MGMQNESAAFATARALHWFIVCINYAAICQTVSELSSDFCASSKRTRVLSSSSGQEAAIYEA